MGDLNLTCYIKQTPVLRRTDTESFKRYEQTLLLYRLESFVRQQVLRKRG